MIYWINYITMLCNTRMDDILVFKNFAGKFRRILLHPDFRKKARRHIEKGSIVVESVHWNTCMDILQDRIGAAWQVTLLPAAVVADMAGMRSMPSTLLTATSTGLFTRRRRSASSSSRAVRPALPSTRNSTTSAMDAVNTAESERLARKAAGAAEAELRDLDAKVGALVTKAEKLKVQADYLRELYEDKKAEYKSK